MKTANEWRDFWFNSDITFTAFVKSIQDEAFHEGQLSGLELGKKTAMETIDEVFKKPADK